MTRTFEEMAAQRDPLYAAMEPILHGDMEIAIIADRSAVIVGRPGGMFYERTRDAALHKLTVRALHNQGQPYYDAR